MKYKKTIVYLLTTFLWSWISWIVALNFLKDKNTPAAMDSFINFFTIGVYGPSLAAITTTFYFDGFKRTLSLLGKLLIWKFPLRYYLIVIFLPPIFLLTGISLYHLFVGNIGAFDKRGISSILTILWAGLFFGPLGEELGWRGFLLPEMQKSFSPVKSSIIIGIIWYCWHIPLFWAPFGTLVSGEPIRFLPLATYLIFVICLSCIYTWLVNNSRGSVLISILVHLFINAGLALVFFPSLAEQAKLVYLLSTAAILVFTSWLVLRTGLMAKQFPEKKFGADAAK